MRLRVWALLALLSTFFVMLIGAYVVKTGAGLSCVRESWPLCNGRLIPPFSSPVDAEGQPLFTQDQMFSEWLHRVFAGGVTGVLTLGVAITAFRRHRDQSDLLTLSVAACGLLFAQALLGKFTVDRGNEPWTVVAHQGLAIAFFGVLLSILVLSWRREAVAAPAGTAAEATAAEAGDGTAPHPTKPSRPLMRVLADYLSLLKPRVLALLLVAAVTSMLVAAGPSIGPGVIVWTVIGGAMASGSGSAFNQWWERDLDTMMERTAKRPVAAGRIPTAHVLAFSGSLALGSFMVLGVFVNLLAALLALAGALFYILVYTLWLKRKRPSNIVIGGAAGSFPVLVGWAAATGQVTLPALLLGFVIFLWTPPHFWALALVHREEYARAGIPMLPVVRGVDHTKQQILVYTVALLACTSSLFFLDVLSAGYLIASLVLGGLFVLLALDLFLDPGIRGANRLFRYSILYLGLLFVTMAVDKLWIQDLALLR